MLDADLKSSTPKGFLQDQSARPIVQSLRRAEPKKNAAVPGASTVNLFCRPPIRPSVTFQPRRRPAKNSSRTKAGCCLWNPRFSRLPPGRYLGPCPL